MSQRKTQSNVIPDELRVCPQESAHWASISSTVKAIEIAERVIYALSPPQTSGPFQTRGDAPARMGRPAVYTL